MHLWMKSAIFLVLVALVAANTSTIPCLQGCQCETGVDSPTIRCDMRKLNYFPLPVTLPHRSYNFLALTCNEIVTIPDHKLIMQAFPQLHGIDLQGNPNLNCSSLAQFEGKLAILSDCDTEIPTACVAPEIVQPQPNPQSNPQPTTRTRGQSAKPLCDLSCKNIVKLRQMWDEIEGLAKQFKVTKIFGWVKEQLAQMTVDTY